MKIVMSKEQWLKIGQTSKWWDYSSLNDFVELGGEELQYGSTEIWYWKDEYSDLMMGYDLAKERGILPNKYALEETHTKLGNIKCSDPTSVYRVMQGENWSPNGEGRDLISMTGLSHTSMSVGDIMVINGKTLMVDSVGFKEL